MMNYSVLVICRIMKLLVNYFDFGFVRPIRLGCFFVSKSLLRGSVFLALTLSLSGCGEDVSDLSLFLDEVARNSLRDLTPIPDVIGDGGASGVGHNFDFDPFVSESIVVESPHQTSNRPKQPLEKFSLTSITMVGTLARGEEISGIVIDPNGVSHRVGLGDYMGESEGRIVVIDDHSITVSQLVSDSQGQFVSQETMLFLAERSGRSDGKNLR